MDNSEHDEGVSSKKGHFFKPPFPSFAVHVQKCIPVTSSLTRNLLVDSSTSMATIKLKPSSRREAVSPSPNPASSSPLFEDSDSDASDVDAKPRKRQISSASDVFSSLAPPAPAREPTLPSQPVEKPKQDKVSQVERLVERRKKMLMDEPAGKDREERDSFLFRYDVDKCADEVALSDYGKTPVDGFGEMMLKKMGWTGKIQKEVKDNIQVRPSLLGLGAKLGGTGKNHLPMKRKRDQAHVDKETLKGNVSEDGHSSHKTANRGKHPKRLSYNRNGQPDERECLAGDASGIRHTSSQSRVNSNPNTYPNSLTTNTQRERGRQNSHQNQYQSRSEEGGERRLGRRRRSRFSNG